MAGPLVIMDQDAFEVLSEAARWVEKMRASNTSLESNIHTSSRSIVFVKVTNATEIVAGRWPGQLYTTSAEYDDSVELAFVEAEGETCQAISIDSTFVPEVEADIPYVGVVIGQEVDSGDPVVLLLGTGIGGGGVSGHDGVAAMITGGVVTGSGLDYFPATADTSPTGTSWTTGPVCRIINLGNNGPLSIGKRYPSVWIGVTSGGVNVYATKGGKTEFVTGITCNAGTITTITAYGDFDLWVGGAFGSAFGPAFSTES